MLLSRLITLNDLRIGRILAQQLLPIWLSESLKGLLGFHLWVMLVATSSGSFYLREDSGRRISDSRKRPLGEGLKIPSAFGDHLSPLFCRNAINKWSDTTRGLGIAGRVRCGTLCGACMSKSSKGARGIASISLPIAKIFRWVDTVGKG